MHYSINEVVQKYIRKNIRHESFDKILQRKGKSISYDLPQIINSEKQKQKLNKTKLQQVIEKNDFRHKSVTNWFTHKKSIESRLFTDKTQREQVKKEQEVFTIEKHKNKLQAYSQIRKHKLKVSPEIKTQQQQKLNQLNQVQLDISITNKIQVIEPLIKTVNLQSSPKVNKKRSTHNQFYKTSVYRNKFMIKVNNHVVQLKDKQLGSAKSKIQNSLYHTFY